jgi:hypothetical protein
MSSSLGRRKRTAASGTIRISRPSLDDAELPPPPLARAQTVHRQSDGKVGSSITHTYAPSSVPLDQEELNPWNAEFFQETFEEPEPLPEPKKTVCNPHYTTVLFPNASLRTEG